MKKCPMCQKAMELEVPPPGESNREPVYVCRAHGCPNNPDFAKVSDPEDRGEAEIRPAEGKRFGVGPLP